jgi:hypothetical protein
MYPSRHIPRLLLPAVLAAVLAFGGGTAVAASAKGKHKQPCWKTLINDWYDGRIDGVYPIHCYREALQHLPTDVDTYSSARDDIKQALQKRITQSHQKGGGSGTGGGTNGGGSGPTKNGPKGGGTSQGPFKDALGRPGKADAVPLPLIVLGAVAVLLMAAGGIGFLTRRNRMRRLQLASVAPGTGKSPPTAS